jgi:hypothetical protein
MSTSRLSSELGSLGMLVASRVAQHLGHPTERVGPIGSYFADPIPFAELPTPDPTPAERVVMLLALVPHVHPDFLERIVAQCLPAGGELPELGGTRGESHRGVLPTGETAQFVLAGDDLADRIAVQRLLSSEHWFAREHVLWLDAVREGEPAMSGRLILDPEIVERLTTGSVSVPRFSTEFPAEHVSTAMTWDDIVLPAETLRQLREIEHWVRFSDTVMGEWGMGRRAKPAIARCSTARRARARRSRRRSWESRPRGPSSASTCRG